MYTINKQTKQNLPNMMAYIALKYTVHYSYIFGMRKVYKTNAQWGSLAVRTLCL